MSKLLYEATHNTPEYLDQVVRCQIDIKMPSLNQYVTECRRNRYAGAKFKRDAEEAVSWYLSRLPKFHNPIFIKFHWTEKTRKRDLDNVSGFGHKVILDAMVKLGKIPDDRTKFVKGFCDSYSIGKTNRVTLYIEEVKS